nr:MAG TPA: hypothetical protein [Bacteriophage sp.]
MSLNFEMAECAPGCGEQVFNGNSLPVTRFDSGRPSSICCV